MNSFSLVQILSFFKCKLKAILHFARKVLFSAAKTYMLKLESKAETENFTHATYHLNSFVLFNSQQQDCLLRNEELRYQQIPNEIMTNQGENEDRNHISTGVSINFIHYMTNLLGQGGVKWVNFAPFFKQISFH